MKNKSPCISLLTDFGIQDSYVGSMKGIILKVNPEVQIVDITHCIHPHDIHAAACMVMNYYWCFPKDTIHVIVVDPGVGSDRNIIAVKTNDYYFVAPDNGVLTYVLKNSDKKAIRVVTQKRYFQSLISPTFHGRDIFASVSAHLSRKDIFAKLGKKYLNPIILDVPKVLKKGKCIQGEIIMIDTFGNLILNIPATMIKKNKKYFLKIKKKKISKFVSTYADGQKDSLLVLPGSNGYLEIACRDGSAKNKVGARVGIGVIIQERG